ncbi:MAG TPA: homocysteine S-methyltransferase family protein, partial [Solirubrobacteraceae bacterium]|nr:homocysteine S-methyltransferase family protein [Solirubrobacteraceae bacterium]
MRDFLSATRERVIVFDGGMGATLEQFDLTSEDYGGLPGKCHEALVLQRPDVIEGVHRSMLEAGAEVVETDTFQASRLKLDEWGLADHTLEINTKAAQIARRAAGEERFVAGSIGPTGHLPASDDPTLGAISFRELMEVFTEQARGLLDGGVDLIIIETAQDILEVKAAVFGARAAFELVGREVPIQTSVSLLPNGGKMLLGTDISAVLATLEALRVDVIGLNCSTGPEDMRDAIRFLGEHCPVPVHCIPNAGLPLQGPDGETIFPERPEPLADALGEFIERYGISIVGGCCGTTPEHIAAIHARCARLPVAPRPAPRPPHVSSMIGATPLVQEPRPTIVGERVNSQGSRRAKKMLLEDDYDGLLTIAEDQVEGGAHVLDLCVALTERPDEAEQMRTLAKRVSLSLDAPIQVDSTEPEVMQTTLEQIPGRAIVNSVNLEAGREKLDRVVPLCLEHGAALIALTIDEDSMGKTAQRKLEIAKRIHGYVVDEHGMDPQLLIFDALTFTLTTGDEEWRPSAVETLEGIRLIKSELPGVKTSLGVSNVSFGVSPPARAVLNSVFLHHAVEAGLDLAMVHPAEVTPYPEIPTEERELADDLVFNRREDALERFIEHFESKGEAAVEEAADPTAGMEPEEALHFHILRRKKEGVEDWIDRSVEKIGAVPTLNEVLLPAMKEVGDKFGAGELILPFVLQSATVMKRAVARLENYLDKVEGYTKGTVVLATVFGDVHDIGKSLVNTILTNNGYTVVDLGKQVPIGTILDAAQEHDATAIGLSALLVSTSKQMPLAVAELHSRQLEYPVLIGGAAINRDFGLRALYPGGRESEELYEPGVFYCKDAFEGLAKMDQLIDEQARAELVSQTREAAVRLREKGPEPEPLATDDDTVRSAARTDVEVPEPPYWGTREVEVDLDEVYPHLDTHVLFKLHWGGRGVKGEQWRRLIDDDFRPRLERMWREQDYLHPRALLGYFPCVSEGNELVVLDPSDHDRELERFVFPRQPGHDRLCIADFYRPRSSGQPDVVALQAVTAGDQVTELMARLEAEGEFAEQLFVHGIGVQTAEGMAEWLHARVRSDLGIEPRQGRRYSWG